MLVNCAVMNKYIFILLYVLQRIILVNKAGHILEWKLRSQLTYILCLSLFLGLPIGFAYRRLIWSAFLCSSFFPFSFGLQTWQIQVPGGCPNIESTIWVSSSIQRAYSTFISNICFNGNSFGDNPACTQWQSITQHKAKIHWINSLSCKIDFMSACWAKLCDFYELPAKCPTKMRAPSLQDLL